MKKENLNQLVSALESRYPDAKVIVKDIVKNNNTVLTGISILEEGQNIVPNIYLEGLRSETVASAVEEYVQIYEASKNPSVDVSKIYYWNQIKDSITARLVNYEANKEMLQDIPYIKIGNLAKIFNIEVSAGFGCIGSIIVNNDLMGIWEVVTIEDLDEVAKDNALDIPIEDMADMFKNTFPYPIRRGYMYISGRKNPIYEAISILYPTFPEKVKETIGCNAYVIPSSVHECILVPEHFGPAEEIEPMISMVNTNNVAPEEVLSDTLYFIDVEKRRLSYAESGEVIYVY